MKKQCKEVQQLQKHHILTLRKCLLNHSKHSVYSYVHRGHLHGRHAAIMRIPLGLPLITLYLIQWPCCLGGGSGAHGTFKPKWALFEKLKLMHLSTGLSSLHAAKEDLESKSCFFSISVLDRHTWEWSCNHRLLIIWPNSYNCVIWSFKQIFWLMIINVFKDMELKTELDLTNIHLLDTLGLSCTEF